MKYHLAGITVATQATVVTGSATLQGKLWGARARDWAEFLEQLIAVPMAEAVLKATKVGPGTDLLDVGCGSGALCMIAAGKGAKITGLDAADALIAIAQEHTPSGDFRTGEMEDLPYLDGTFDVVIGINSFQYAANPVHALQEARRVARPGGLVAIAIWGRPEDCEATGYLNALRSLIPPPPPGAPSPTAIEVDSLEEIARQAGLKPEYSAEVDAPFHFPDLETALRALNSSGPAQRAIQASGEDKVREAISKAIAPYKTPTGGYRMENKFIFLVTEA